MPRRTPSGWRWSAQGRPESGRQRPHRARRQPLNLQAVSTPDKGKSGEKHGVRRGYGEIEIPSRRRRNSRHDRSPLWSTDRSAAAAGEIAIPRESRAAGLANPPVRSPAHIIQKSYGEPGRRFSRRRKRNVGPVSRTGPAGGPRRDRYFERLGLLVRSAKIFWRRAFEYIRITFPLYVSRPSSSFWSCSAISFLTAPA